MPEYTKLNLLGEGSHAKVYLVSGSDGQQYALKEFLLGQDEDFDELQSRFLVEKTVLTQVQNQNVVKLIDTIELGMERSIVMELCQHGCLKSQLKNIGPFSLERTIMSGLSILDGLEGMHQAGFLHRDLKPDNILQGEGGVLKIADMGLAKGTDFENKYCQGTVAYMSPEQHTDYNNTDERSDIYSVGATLYHLYTGEELFSGNSIEDILDSHKNCIIPSLKHSRPDCSLTFNHVVRKMIAKKPADRYQNVSEVRLDLEAVLNGVQGINELPSIQNIKVLADTLSNEDIPFLTAPGLSQNKIYGMVALLVICLGIILLLPTKEGKTEPVVTQLTEESKDLTGEAAIADFVEEVEEPQVLIDESVPEVSEKAETSESEIEASLELIKEPIAAVQVPKKVDEFKYIEPILRNLPIRLLEVSSDLLSCKLLIKKQEVEVLYGESKNQVKVIELTKDQAVAVFNDKAYRLKLGESNLFYTGFHRFMINDRKVTMSLTRSYRNLKLVKAGMKRVTLMDKDNITIELEAQKTIRDFLKPIWPQKRQELEGLAAGGVLEFKEFQHKVFPVLLTGVAGNKVQLMDSVGKKTVNKKSEIILGRLQIVNVETDSAEFRDIRTSKSYTLYKDEKYILKKAALFVYKGETHRVIDGSVFFGYPVTFEEDKISFKVDADFSIHFGFDQARIFLPQYFSNQ